jgi:hypothetical protein
MMIYNYREAYTGRNRVIVILSETRALMRVGLIQGGKVIVKKLAMTEKEFMTPIDGKRNQKKAAISMRKLVAKKGHTGKLREEVKEATSQL